MRILLQIRPNAFSQRGGDTVVFERLRTGLQALGHHVLVEHEPTVDASSFDIVHLFNFATAEIIESQARNLVKLGTPFVVTTLYEDWPKFFAPMVIQAQILRIYVEYGQPTDQWERFKDVANRATTNEIQDNSFTAEHAKVLIMVPGPATI